MLSIGQKDFVYTDHLLLICLAEHFFWLKKKWGGWDVLRKNMAIRSIAIFLATAPFLTQPFESWPLQVFHSRLFQPLSALPVLVFLLTLCPLRYSVFSNLTSGHYLIVPSIAPLINNSILFLILKSDLQATSKEMSLRMQVSTGNLRRFFCCLF